MSIPKLRLGTTAWFEMLGTLMCEAAARSGMSPELNVSFVERYADGVELEEGLVQGFRFDIVAGRPSFRIGVRHHEQGDITIEITTAAAQTLNSLRSDDPAYPAAVDTALKTGGMRMDGDPSRLGGWLQALHDPIVDRTL